VYEGVYLQQHLHAVVAPLAARQVQRRGARRAGAYTRSLQSST